MDRRIGKLKLSRGEFAFCGALLLGAVGFGVYRLDQIVYKAQVPKILEEATRTVAFGETLPLTCREFGRENNQIPWNGIVEMRLKKVALYPSYTAALTVENTIANPNNLFRDKKDPFLVIEVEATNIDAEEDNPRYVGTAKAEHVSSSDGAVGLEIDLFFLNAYGRDFAASTRYANGTSLIDYSNPIVVAQGETAQIVLGFCLADHEEEHMVEHLDGATLRYWSYYDLMDIGSPRLEDGKYAVTLQ